MAGSAPPTGTFNPPAPGPPAVPPVAHGAPPQSSKAQYGHLIVFIFEGMELMAKEGSGKGNPYVVAYIDEDAFAEAEEKAKEPAAAVPAVAPASGTGDGAAKADEAEDKKRTEKDEKKSKNRPLRTRGLFV